MRAIASLLNKKKRGGKRKSRGSSFLSQLCNRAFKSNKKKIHKRAKCYRDSPHDSLQWLPCSCGEDQENYTDVDVDSPENLDLLFAYRRLLGGSFTIICCTLQRTKRWWADYDLRGRYNLRQDDHVCERTRAHARVVKQLLVPLPLIILGETA